MTEETQGSSGEERIDASLKKQDQAILEAFSRAEHQVVLSREIGEFVDLSDRQIRRRLKDLASRDIVGTRKPGRDRLWWLKEEVKEPITAQYPLLRFARDRLSIQFLLIGLAIGIIAVVLVPAASIAFAYNTSPPLISRSELLQAGLLASMLAALFLITSVIFAGLGWVLRYLGIEPLSSRFG